MYSFSGRISEYIQGNTRKPIGLLVHVLCYCMDWHELTYLSCDIRNINSPITRKHHYGAINQCTNFNNIDANPCYRLTRYHLTTWPEVTYGSPRTLRINWYNTKRRPRAVKYRECVSKQINWRFQVSHVCLGCCVTEPFLRLY